MTNKKTKTSIVKRIIAMICSVIVVVSALPMNSIVLAGNNELVENGSFSSGLENWKIYDPAVASDGEALIMEEGGYRGAYVSIADGIGAGYGIETDADALIPVDAGEEYTLTYWVMCENASLTPEIIQLTSEGQSASVPFVGLGAYVRQQEADWTEVSATFRTAEDAAYLQLQFVAQGGTAGVDEVSLKLAKSKASKLLNTYSLGAPRTTSELIMNGDMSLSSGWTATSVNAANGSGVVTYDSDGGHDGQALKYTYTDNAESTATSNSSIRMSDSKVAVEPNTTYIFSAWLKTDTNTRFALQALEYNAANESVNTYTLYKTGTTAYVHNHNQGWVQYALEFTTGADAATLLPQISLRDMNSTRNIWIDDVSVTKKAEPNVLGLITNGDMALSSGWMSTSVSAANGSGVVTYDSDGGHDGQALKYTYTDNAESTATSNSSIRMSDSKVAVEPNTTYIFSAWLKTDTNTRFTLQALEYDADDTLANRYTLYQTGTTYYVHYVNKGWVQYTLEFTTGADAATLLPQINLMDMGSSRNIWIDNVSLTKRQDPIDPDIVFEDDMEGDYAWRLNGETDGLSKVQGGYESDTALKIDLKDAAASTSGFDILEPSPRTYDVEPNQGYTMSMWVKTENMPANSSQLFLQMVQRKNATTNVAKNSHTKGIVHRNAPTEWTQIVVRFITEADATCVIPQMYIKGSSDSIVYVDQVELRKDDTVPKLEPTDNFGFEYAETGYPVNWTASLNSGSGATVSYGVSNDAVEGKQSGYLSIEDASAETPASVALHTGYFEVEPSTVYEVSIRVKVIGNYSSKVRAYTSNHKENQAACSQASCWANTAYNVIGVNDGWTELRYSVTTPEDVALWRLHLTLSGYDTIAYFDDIRVTAVEPTSNLSFEEAANDRPTSWYYTVYGDTDFDAVTMDYEQYHDGKSSVHFDFNAVETSTNTNYRTCAALLENPYVMSVTGDTYYQYSMWFKSRGAIGMPVIRLTMTIYDDEGNVVQAMPSEKVYLNAGNEVSDWMQVTQTSYIPSTAAYACMWIQVSAGVGEVWVDDIDIRVVQENGEEEKLISYHDFTAVDEKGNISGWSCESVKGEATLVAENGIGTLTVPSGSEGYAVAQISTILGDNTYEFTGFYTAGAAGKAILKFRDYKGDYVEGAEVSVDLPNTGNEKQPFTLRAVAANAAIAELWLGGANSGTYCFETVAGRLVGKPDSGTDWEGQWVWYPEEPRETAQADTRYFREVFYLEDTPVEAPMQMTADDKCTIYVNGEQVYSNMDAAVDSWSQLKSMDLLPYLKKGENVIAIEVYNRTTDAGLLYDCRISMKNGDMYKLLSGEQIKSNLVSEFGWTLLNYDDSDWKTVRVYGYPPISPWGNIYFDNSYYVDCLMEVVEFNLPKSVEAGSELTVDAVVRIEKEIEKDFDLKFNYIVRNTIRQAGSAYVEILEGGQPTTWKPNTDIHLKLRFVMPDFIGEGRYNIMMDDNYVIITNEDAVDNQFADIRVTKDDDNAPSRITAEVKMYNGAPTIFIDGEPQSSMLALRVQNSASFNAQYYRQLYDLGGIDLGITFNGHLEEIWKSDGSIDFDYFDSKILETLAASPDSYIMPNINLDVPAWWAEKYPDEMHVTQNGYVCEQSFASEIYREEVGKVLRDILEHIKGADYFCRVYGIRLTAGDTAEWMSTDHDSDTASASYDFSKAALESFRNYLREIYENDVSKLRQAWNNSTVTFETAEFATIEELTKSEYLHIFDPGTQRQCIDMNAALSLDITDSFLYFCQIVKETTDEKLIVGGYNGYLQHITSGGMNGKATIGVQKLYNSPYVDFIASPLNYNERAFGLSSSSMIMLDGAQAHGKLVVFEADNRTVTHEPSYNATNDERLGQTFTIMETIYQLRRDFNNVFINGSGTWYFDMEGNYFTNSQIVSAIGQMHDEMDFGLNLDRTSTSEVALFVDEDMITYVTKGNTNPIMNYLFLDQRSQLATMGAPYDTYTLSDLVDGVVKSDYKVNIMLSPYQVTDEEAAAIDKYLKKDGKTLVWIYMSAVTDGTEFDFERAGDIMGIDIGLNNIKSMLQTQISDIAHPITDGIEGIRYGNLSPSAGPQTYVDDTQATILGNLAGSELGGLAIKEMEDWTSIYSASPGLINELLRNILEYAGVHMYSESGSDVIYANENYVSLHSVQPGQKTISLDGTYSVYDVFAEEMISWETDTIVYDHEENATKLFRLMSPNKVSVMTKVNGKGGTISPKGVTEVDKNGSLTITVTPDAGYELEKVTVNGKEVTLTDGKLHLSNLTEYQLVKARFKKIPSLQEEITDDSEDEPTNSFVSNSASKPTVDLSSSENAKKQQIITRRTSIITYNWPAIIALIAGGVAVIVGLIVFLLLWNAKHVILKKDGHRLGGVKVKNGVAALDKISKKHMLEGSMAIVKKRYVKKHKGETLTLADGDKTITTINVAGDVDMFVGL